MVFDYQLNLFRDYVKRFDYRISIGLILSLSFLPLPNYFNFPSSFYSNLVLSLISFFLIMTFILISFAIFRKLGSKKELAAFINSFSAGYIVMVIFLLIFSYSINSFEYSAYSLIAGLIVTYLGVGPDSEIGKKKEIIAWSIIMIILVFGISLFSIFSVRYIYYPELGPGCSAKPGFVPNDRKIAMEIEGYRGIDLYGANYYGYFGKMNDTTYQGNLMGIFETPNFYFSNENLVKDSAKMSCDSILDISRNTQPFNQVFGIYGERDIIPFQEEIAIPKNSYSVAKEISYSYLRGLDSNENHWYQEANNGKYICVSWCLKDKMKCITAFAFYNGDSENEIIQIFNSIGCKN